MRFRGGAQAITQLLSLPPTTEEKEACFATLGRGIQQAGQVLDEAVFVSGSWYVATEKGERLELDVAPSQHPKRKEAITIVGRNAARTHFTMVVQTFGRDRRNQPAFGPIEMQNTVFPRMKVRSPRDWSIIFFLDEFKVSL